MRSLLITCMLLVTGAAASQGLVEQRFHDNGRVSSTLFSDGVVTHYMAYHPSGRVHEMGSYRAGLRDGVWKQFDENGEVVARIEFSMGKRKGTWEFFDRSTAGRMRLEYREGHLARGEQFGADGALIAQRTY